MYNCLVILRSPDTKIHIAAAVTSHGFGHAARTCAVLERLRSLQPDIIFEIFSEAPKWFFDDSLGAGYQYHCHQTDVGLIQKTPFDEDLDATCVRLNQTLLDGQELVDGLANQLTRHRCRLVLCDISPIGILAAEKAGIPSILIENFTWDWVYQGYFAIEPQLLEVSDMLKSIFSRASLHIQAEPICLPRRCDLVTRPIARRSRLPGDQVRLRLGVPGDHKMVLIVTGGVEQSYQAIDALLATPAGIHFVLPGNVDQVVIQNRITILPHHSEYFHPDLVDACDAVVGKPGYSTLAEAYHAGIPFGCVQRETFRESNVLVSYVVNNLGGLEISYQDFISGDWIKFLPRLLENQRQERSTINGADEIASYLVKNYFGVS